MTGAVRRECVVALRSAFIYLLLVVPLYFPTMWKHWAIPFITNYQWLPFWYSALISLHCGGVVDYVCHSLLGTAAALLAAVLLNYLMPGGAGPLSSDPSFDSQAWLIGGYSEIGALIYAALCSYGMYFTKRNVVTKQYMLSAFATILVEFMNPQQNSTDFRAVLWDWNFHWNWGGPVLCSVYLVLLAVPLSVLTLPFMPGIRCLHAECRCQTLAAEGLESLAVDTIGGLERLLTYFQEGVLNFNVDSSFFYIRELGARRTALEALLEQAQWECWGQASKAKLQSLKRFSDLLRGLRQALRIQLEQLRNAAQPQFTSPSKLSRHAVDSIRDRFVHACRKALAIAVERIRANRFNENGNSIQEARDLMFEADGALVMALQELAEPGEGTKSDEMAFVDALRMWPSLIGDFLAEEHEPGHRDNDTCWRHYCCVTTHDYWKCIKSWVIACVRARDQHIFALRNCVSWMLGLLWSVYLRGCRSGCAVSVAFLMTPSIGSLTDRNINRMLGVALGIYVGNLPEALLMQKGLVEQKHDILAARSFYHYPQGLIMYLALMFMMWMVAIYGYLATGAKYSYACLLWAGFGGVQMLKRLKLTLPLPTNVDSEYVLFMDTMDCFAGCLIIFFVDLLAAYLTSEGASDRVAKTLPECLASVASVVDHISTCDEVAECERQMDCLQKNIKVIRSWDVEVQKEDHIWNAPWKSPYKIDFVHAMLDHCDTVYVTAQTMCASAKRCKYDSVTKAICEDALPREIARRAKTYARFAASALKERPGPAVRRRDRLGSLPDVERRLSGRAGRQHSDDHSRSISADSCPSSSLVRAPSWNEHVSPLFGRQLTPPSGSGVDFEPLPASELGPAEAAAAVAFRGSAWAMRSALQRIEVLLREEAYWTGERQRCRTGSFS